MDDRTPNTTDMTPRRGFIRCVAGAMALGLTGLVPSPSHPQPAAARSDGPEWPGPLKGRHRQLVDAYEVNDGSPLAFAYTFLSTNEPPTANLVSATAVIVLRHAAFPMALGNEMWRKYKIGEAFKILDPETKAPAVKNPFLHPKPGVLPPGRHGDRPLARERHSVRRLPRRATGPKQDARQQRRCERRAGGEGMDRQCHPRDYNHSIGDMGCEPSAGGRLYLLRGRLITFRSRFV